jgi:hypothetical protein
MTIENNTIIVYYPVAAGGKFFINSLGLSRHCVLHNVELARWDLDQSVFTENYYKTKLNHVLKTIPPDQNSYWQSYELGVFNYWLSFENNPPTCSSALKDIVSSGRHCCVITHNPEYLVSVMSAFSLKNIVKLTNYTKWLMECSFKVSGLTEDIKNKVDYWGYIDQKEIADPAYNYLLVDVDNSMRDQTAMTKQIKNLYNHFGFDDFNEDLWLQYYKRYINFHDEILLTRN